MKRQLATLMVYGGIAVLATGCATKGFVRQQVASSETRLGEQVSSAETKLGQRIDTQERTLRDTAERSTTNTQAIDATGQRVQGLDARVGEVGALANDAKRGVDAVAHGLRETDARLSHRLANRNKYSTLETKSIYFDFAKATLRDEGINELEEVARALKTDPNAVVELQGFADPRGGARYNYRLTQERVDAVIRYLVRRHGIELRRIYGVGMGKVTSARGTAKRSAYAKSRRVDIRLLAPQS